MWASSSPCISHSPWVSDQLSLASIYLHSCAKCGVNVRSPYWWSEQFAQGSEASRGDRDICSYIAVVKSSTGAGGAQKRQPPVGILAGNGKGFWEAVGTRPE